MKGFIRAKGLDELQHPTAAGDESHTEQGDLAGDHVSRETQTFLREVAKSLNDFRQSNDFRQGGSAILKKHETA